MSSPPIKYARQANYTDFSAAHPNEPHSGPSMDADFNAVGSSLNKTIDRLNEIQRDDGKLENNVVTPESLDFAVLAMVGSEQGNPRGVWATGVDYAASDLVSFGNPVYIAIAAHHSGVFNTDLAAGKWMLFTVDGNAIAAQAAAAAAAAAGSASAQAQASAAAAAQSAADAALYANVAGTADGIYPNTAAGLAATAEGGYFWVPNPVPSLNILDLYREVGGSAIYINSLVSADNDQFYIDHAEYVWDFSKGVIPPDVPGQPGGVTFRRDTTGTLVNVLGRQATAAAQVPRFDYEPVSHAARGIIVEDYSHLVVKGHVIADWNPLVGVTGLTGLPSPDGGGNAIGFTVSATNDKHGSTLFPGTVQAIGSAVASLFLGQWTHQFVQLYVGDGSFNHGAYVNIDTFNWTITKVQAIGNVSVVGTQLYQAATPTITGNWHRFAMQLKFAAPTAVGVYLLAVSSANSVVLETWLGAGSQMLFHHAEFSLTPLISSDVVLAATGLYDRAPDRLKIYAPQNVKQFVIECANGRTTRQAAQYGLCVIDPTLLPSPYVKRVYGINGTILSNQVSLAFHGDSMTLGSGAAYPFPRIVRDGLTNSGMACVLNTRGMSGASWNAANGYSGANLTMAQDAILEIDPTYTQPVTPGMNNHWLIVFAGSNGLVLNGHTAAQEWADMQAYLDARFFAGWHEERTIFCTMLPRQTFSEAIRTQYNDLMVAGAAYYGSKIARFDLDPNIGLAGQQNSDYFADTIHLSDKGHIVAAGLIRAALGF